MIHKPDLRWYIFSFSVRQWFPWRTLRVMTCIRCTMLIDEMHVADHDDWHDQLLCQQCDRPRERRF